MSSTAEAGSTCKEYFSGLCELCDEAAEVECAACGPVRLNKTDGGPLLLCAECSTSLHSKRVFECHKLVNISRKLWLPVEEKLELVKQHGTMLNERKTKLMEEVKAINDNYNIAIEQLEMTMKDLRKAVDDKEQALISNLTDVKDQQLLNGEHVNAVCTSLTDHVTKITSKVNESLILEARRFAEQKATLLQEMSSILEQPIPPLLSVSDITFSLADSITMVKRQMNDLLILPVLAKQVRAGECTQGAVVGKLNPQGLFWLKIIRRESEGALMVISQSIRADLEHDVIKPVTKATVGQFCCAFFSEDKQWHRARVVTMVSTTRVRICYIDYGNYEECSLTNLRSLPDKYLFYPFQTIRCCLTNDDGVEFSREARWLFNDRTKNIIVNTHIISELPSSSIDDNDVHYLVAVKEAREGGADISSLVLSKLKEDQKQPKHPIIHRDYRLTQQHKLPASTTPLPAEAPPNRPPSRLNTDAAEFVLNKQPPLQQQQQPGVLQVSQSVFHKMVGVSVTKTPSKADKNVTGTVKDIVTTTPDGRGDCATSDSPTTNTVTTASTGIVESVNAATVTVDNVTATPVGMGNNVITTPADNGTTANGNITNTLLVTENNITTTTTTDNVIATPSGVGDVVTSDGQDSVKITPSEVGDNGEVKDDMISSTEDGNVTTTDMMGDTVNDKEEKEMTGSVDTQQSENLPNDNEALPCSDSNGCHGSHECTDSKDVTSSNVNNVRSHDPEVGVVSSHEIDDVAPPPNEAVVAGATIEISVVSELHNDGRFWSQLVADEETDESFCDLMESLQSICVELHSSQQYPQGTPLVGSLCAALFSADNIWYRALVEQVTGDQLLVRYMDYGNAEMVSHGNIVPLTPKMKELPFQAFLSTISSDERNNFTPLMCERFSSLVKTNDVFQAKVLSVKGGVVEVELTVQLNGEMINVNDDVYLTDFVTTHSLHFSQATDPKLTWTEQMEALDSPVTPTKDLTFQLATGNPEQPLPRERSKSTGKSKSHKSSPVCSVRKISNCSSRRMLRRQSSSEKPSGNKKQQKKTTAVANEDTGIVPSSENWETEEESLVGGAGGSKDDVQMLFIKGLPPTINMEVVRKLFSEHGNVKEVNFDHSYPGRARIIMDVKGARNAMSHLRNHVMSGGDPRGLLINETENFHPKSRFRGQGLFKRY